VPTPWRPNGQPTISAARCAFSLTFPSLSVILLIDLARGRPRSGPVSTICWRSQSVAGRGACRSSTVAHRSRHHEHRRVIVNIAEQNSFGRPARTAVPFPLSVKDRPGPQTRPPLTRCRVVSRMRREAKHGHEGSACPARAVAIRRAPRGQFTSARIAPGQTRLSVTLCRATGIGGRLFRRAWPRGPGGPRAPGPGAACPRPRPVPGAVRWPRRGRDGSWQPGAGSGGACRWSAVPARGR